MEDINIIHYKPCYAKAVAEMWRKSSKGWNGDYLNTTEEHVLKQTEGSTSIDIYLAEKAGEILGYCDFSQYLDDEGALYIRLLNVRYDCHGKGIGKALVIKALERTIELGWPRLDLYTWPGNKKSIPLYKKCGFFLEDREDTTHLMNFIPYVLNTEAVREIFRDIHWYKDMKRTISMEPDGRGENGFNFYEYLWEKEGASLRMEFEKSGRGLRLIETEDYIIKADLDRQDVVLGQSLSICYEAVNKSGKPLHIEIKGVDNKNIEFDFHEARDIKDRERFYGSFHAGEITEEASPYRTYPAVVSEVFINGKKAVFKLGVKPERPAKISLKGINAPPYACDEECFKGAVSGLYLDIENNFDAEAVFSFSLAGNHDIEFLDKDFNIAMKPKEKKSLKVGCILKDYCLYSENVPVTAELKDGKKLRFSTVLTCLFKGREGAFGGEAEDCFIIVNGAYSVKQNKLNNKTYVREYENEDAKTFFDAPKVGKPYTSEFYNIRPNKVIWYKDGEWMVLESTCASQRYKNIEVTAVFRLSANGVTEHYIKVFNNSESQSPDDIYLLQSCNHYILSRGALPMDGKVIEIVNGESEDLNSFDINKLTENWIFCKTDKMSRGFCWDKKLKPKISDWFMGFEYNFGKMRPKQTAATEPVKLAMNTFHNWRDFRSFALGCSSPEDMASAEDLEINVNEGNPFVKEKFKVEFIEHKQQPLSGEFRLSSKNGSIKNVSLAVSAGDKRIEAEIAACRYEGISLDVLNMQIESALACVERNMTIFPVKDIPIEEEIIKDQGSKVYSVNNGLIDIKADAEFSPSLFSMKYEGQEWLESAYPKPAAKSWFNPWVGGILSLPEELGLRTVLEEKTEVDFAKLFDNHNNCWKGLRSHISIRKNEKYAGLELYEYFLLLSGVPVMCHTAEIVQNMGRYMDRESFENMSFFSIDKDIKNNYILLKNKRGEYVKYKSGQAAAEIFAGSSMLIGSKDHNQKLQIFTRFEKARPMTLLNTNDTACCIYERITAADKQRVFTTPLFYIFTDEMLEDRTLKDLRNIYF